jgi:hypothetical protein
MCVDENNASRIVLRADVLGARALILDPGASSLKTTEPNVECAWTPAAGTAVDVIPEASGDAERRAYGKLSIPDFYPSHTYRVGDQRVTTGFMNGNSKVAGEDGAHLIGWNPSTNAITWRHSVVSKGHQMHNDSVRTVVTADLLFHTFEPEDGPEVGSTQIVAWSMKTGSLSWTVAWPHSAESNAVTALDAGGGHLFVVVDRTLVVLEAATGKVEKVVDKL